jgi:prepilin peptidase CpaA
MIPQGLHPILSAMALLALMASAYTDIKDRIIPNELVVLVAACGAALVLTGRPEHIWIGASAAVVTLFALGTLAHFGMIGGGDAKMIAAVTLLVPPNQIGTLLIFIVMAGGVLSVVYILARYTLRSRNSGKTGLPAGAVCLDGDGWFRRECTRIAAGGPMPYGVAIFGGAAGILARELPRCLPGNFCFF